MKFEKTRTFSASMALAFLAATALAGCSADASDSSEDGVFDDLTGEGIAGDESDKAGDSFVQWCNARGTDGTICVQQGCTASACFDREDEAVAECRVEVRRICGSPVQPWFIIFKADGFRQRLF